MTHLLWITGISDSSWRHGSTGAVTSNALGVQEGL